MTERLNSTVCTDGIQEVMVSWAFPRDAQDQDLCVTNDSLPPGPPPGTRPPCHPRISWVHACYICIVGGPPKRVFLVSL